MARVLAYAALWKYLFIWKDSNISHEWCPRVYRLPLLSDSCV